jgi:ATP-dependent DNA helicase RecG
MENFKPEEIVDSILAGQMPEGYEVDWTLGTKNLDVLGEKIAAFATSGGGWLIIGLNDERPPKVIGVNDEQTVITQVGSVLRNCDPIPTTSSPKFIERQGKKIAIYKITGLGGNICSYRDVSYHRVQDSAKKMTQNNFRDIFTRRNMLTWEQRPSPATKTDIDRSELLFYMKKAAERNSLNPQTEENFLKSNKAIMEQGDQLTNLGTIVLVDNPSYFLPQCKIQLVRFRGDKPIDRIAAILLSTTARKLIDSCINFLKLNLPVRTYYQGSDRFEEPIIPEIVLREIVVNMIVHRDYSDPQESLIRIFDDRVEFQNPGAPTPAELEKILNQGIPTHRNQWIYNFLRPVHKAEAAGQGIPIIKREMMRRGLEQPEITILSNIFHLNLKFAERKPETLGDIILLYGRERGILSTSDVMKVHKISRPTAIRILNELVSKGLAKHYGERRGSTYHFN